MTIEATADVNAVAATGTTVGLPTNPEGDQEADSGPDVKEVTLDAEGAQEVLLVHVLLEGITHDMRSAVTPESSRAQALASSIITSAIVSVSMICVRGSAFNNWGSTALCFFLGGRSVGEGSE